MDIVIAPPLHYSERNMIGGLRTGKGQHNAFDEYAEEEKKIEGHPSRGLGSGKKS